MDGSAPFHGGGSGTVIPMDAPCRLAPCRDAVGGDATRSVPVEMPVSVEVNGIGIAVMMATPADLEDYVVGFARSEGLLGDIAEMRDITLHRHPVGWIARLRVTGAAAATVQARARARITESACGLCGLETLEALAAPIPRIPRPLTVAPQALAAAREALSPRQTLGRLTRGTHAAALCDARGEIVLIREDVGRHNAMDKMVGAGMAAGIAFDAHFALLTSRLSFELVEKAAASGIGALAALSAPTSLALDRAALAGLPLHAALASTPLHT